MRLGSLRRERRGRDAALRPQKKESVFALEKGVLRLEKGVFALETGCCCSIRRACLRALEIGIFAL